MIYKILFLPVGEYLKTQVYPFEIEREFSNKRKAKRFIRRRTRNWNGWYNWSDHSSTSWRVIEDTNIVVIKEHLEIVRIS